MSKLKSHEIVKVVSELIGCTVPQGDPALDIESMDNLDNLIAMTWWSLNEIARTARCKDDPEEMGEHAQSVLLSMADWIAYVSLRDKEQP